MTDELLDLIRFCRMCQNAYGAPGWPDGGSILDQPVKLVAAFNMIRSLSSFYEKPR